MKNLFLFLAFALLMSNIVFAEEVNQANQDMNIQDNKAVVRLIINY